MAPIVENAARIRQSATTDPTAEFQSANADLDLWRARLRQAMVDTHWNCEALDAHWQTSRGYASSLVNGERGEKWTLARILALPPDVRARMAELDAAHHGLLVVPPAVTAFIGEFVGVLVAVKSLPSPNGAHAKASLPITERRAVAR